MPKKRDPKDQNESLLAKGAEYAKKFELPNSELNCILPILEQTDSMLELENVPCRRLNWSSKYLIIPQHKTHLLTKLLIDVHTVRQNDCMVTDNYGCEVLLLNALSQSAIRVSTDGSHYLVPIRPGPFLSLRLYCQETPVDLTDIQILCVDDSTDAPLIFDDPHIYDPIYAIVESPNGCNRESCDNSLLAATCCTKTYNSSLNGDNTLLDTKSITVTNIEKLSIDYDFINIHRSWYVILLRTTTPFEEFLRTLDYEEDHSSDTESSSDTENHTHNELSPINIRSHVEITLQWQNPDIDIGSDIIYIDCPHDY